MTLSGLWMFDNEQIQNMVHAHMNECSEECIITFRISLMNMKTNFWLPPFYLSRYITTETPGADAIETENRTKRDKRRRRYIDTETITQLLETNPTIFTVLLIIHILVIASSDLIVPITLNRLEERIRSRLLLVSKDGLRKKVIEIIRIAVR